MIDSTFPDIALASAHTILIVIFSQLSNVMHLNEKKKQAFRSTKRTGGSGFNGDFFAVLKFHTFKQKKQAFRST